MVSRYFLINEFNIPVAPKQSPGYWAFGTSENIHCFRFPKTFLHIVVNIKLLRSCRGLPFSVEVMSAGLGRLIPSRPPSLLHDTPDSHMPLISHLCEVLADG